MPTYYLLGGENTRQRDAQTVNEQAFSDAGGNPVVLVFSWARACFDRSYIKSKRIFDYFRSLGANSVSFVDYSWSNGEIKDALSQANVVYLTGGVPAILLERLKRLGVDELLCGFGGVVVGRSAGALALCSRCVTTLRDSKKVRVVDGLRLVPLTLKAHYKLGTDEALMEFSRQEDIYAVPKDSAVVYRNGELSYIGDVYLFHKGTREMLK